MNTPPGRPRTHYTQILKGARTRKERIIGLDIVRVTLAFIIFLFHSRIHIHCDYGLLNTFVDKGNIIAMTAFFMLSGYSLVISNGSKNYCEFDNVVVFYKKRFISIWPLYFVAGYLGVAMYIAIGQQTIIDNIVLLPVEILCIQSFFDTLFPFAHNAGSWFISCLVACYFLFPWLNILLKQIRYKRICLLLVFIVVLLTYFPYIVERFQTSSLYTNPFFRILEFLSGMIIAQINTKDGQNSTFLSYLRTPKICISCAVILIGGMSLCNVYHIYCHWMPIVFLSVILFGAGYIHFPQIWNNRYLLYLSSISYAFFLGQKFVWIPTKYVLHHTDYQIGNVTLVLITLIACVISAIILHELVENRASRFLKPRLL